MDAEKGATIKIDKGRESLQLMKTESSRKGDIKAGAVLTHQYAVNLMMISLALPVLKEHFNLGQRWGQTI